jgi:hypothetical protein
MKLDNIIDVNVLFWGNNLISEMLEKEIQLKLCGDEFQHWLSFIYWGEDLAMRYSERMLQVSTNKERWEKIYKEEYKHKTVIANWMLERDITPLKKNALIERSYLEIEKIKVDSDENARIIEEVQLFLEEALYCTIKYRFNSVIDRDLKSIFYTLLNDEASHIAEGKKEIIDMGAKPPKFCETIMKYSESLFPISLAKKILLNETIVEIKSKIPQIVDSVISSALDNTNNMNYPEPILKKFMKIEQYNCIACCPKRVDGLHLEPKLIDNVVYDNFRFPKRCEGFSGIVHGGFVMMVLDEISCYAPILKHQHIPLTKSLDVNFKMPVKINETYKIQSKVIEKNGQVYKVYSSIEKEGIIYAEANGEFYIPNTLKADKILGPMAKSPVIKELLYT